MRIVKSYDAADRSEVLWRKLILFGNESILQIADVVGYLDCALHLARAVHKCKFNQLVSIETVQVIYKVADLAEGFITEHTGLFHV